MNITANNQSIISEILDDFCGEISIQALNKECNNRLYFEDSKVGACLLEKLGFKCFCINRHYYIGFDINNPDSHIF